MIIGEGPGQKRMKWKPLWVIGVLLNKMLEAINIKGQKYILPM